MRFHILSDRSEAKGTVKLSDLLVRSRRRETILVLWLFSLVKICHSAAFSTIFIDCGVLSFWHFPRAFDIRLFFVTLAFSRFVQFDTFVSSFGSSVTVVFLHCFFCTVAFRSVVFCQWWVLSRSCSVTVVFCFVSYYSCILSFSVIVNFDNRLFWALVFRHYSFLSLWFFVATDFLPPLCIHSCKLSLCDSVWLDFSQFRVLSLCFSSCWFYCFETFCDVVFCAVLLCGSTIFHFGV